MRIYIYGSLKIISYSYGWEVRVTLLPLRTSSINSEGLPNQGLAAYVEPSLLQRPFRMLETSVF